MRKVLFALLVVSLFAFGLRTVGEGAYTSIFDCISRIDFYGIETPGKAQVTVTVGKTLFVMTADGMIFSTSPGTWPYLTYAQVAAFEPILASLRAGAAARVKASVQWNESTNRVFSISVVYGAPCTTDGPRPAPSVVPRVIPR